jgi:hypothetical protein
VRGPVHQPHLPAHSDPAGQEGERARLHPRGREGRPQAQGVLHRGTFIAVLGIRFRMFLGLQDPDPDPLVRGMGLDPNPDPSLFS